MFCVIFEMAMRPGKIDDYFAIAGSLRPELHNVPGFIHNERYEDIASPTDYLSYSVWETERALIRWRTHTKHHYSQSKGRNDIFSKYRLRIGALISSTEGATPRVHSAGNFELTETGPIKSVILREIAADGPIADHRQPTALEVRRLRSLVREGVYIELSGWGSETDAEDYIRTASSRTDGRQLQARHFCVLRDYTLIDRNEAPQFYPKVRAPNEPPTDTQTNQVVG